MSYNRASQIGRLLCLLAGTLLVATQSLAGTTNEPNTDRRGSDYAGYNLPSPDPELCRKACDQDAKCRAYTYVKPGVQGPAARCYLKDPAPAAQANDCCVSGVKTATPAVRAAPSNQKTAAPALRAAPTNQPLAPQPRASSTNEPNTDRRGSDYAAYNLPSPDPALCRKACDKDTRCKAYTFVKPGVQGPAARCYLKDPAPAAQANNCCVSGVKVAQSVLRIAPPQSGRSDSTAKAQRPSIAVPYVEKNTGKNKPKQSIGEPPETVAAAKNKAIMVCLVNPLSCCPAKQKSGAGCAAVTKALLDVRIRSYVPPRFTVMGYHRWAAIANFALANIVSDVTVNGPYKVWPGCRFYVTAAKNSIEDSKSILQKGAELAEAWLHQWSSGVESAKAFVADGVADGVCGVVDDTQSCRTKVAGVIKTGINLGLASLGIPPEIPDIQQLREHGVQYLASQAASYALGELDVIGQLPVGEAAREQLYNASYNKAVDVLSKELNKVIPPSNFTTANPATWGHLEPAYMPHNAHLYVEVRIKPEMYQTYLKFITAKPTHRWPPLYLHDLNDIYASMGPIDIPSFIPSGGMILPFTLKPYDVAYTAEDTAPAQIPGVKISKTWLKNKFGLGGQFGLVTGQLNYMPRVSTNYLFSDWDLGYDTFKKSSFRLLSALGGGAGVLDWENEWWAWTGHPRDPYAPNVKQPHINKDSQLYNYYGRIDPAPRCDGKPNVVYGE